MKRFFCSEPALWRWGTLPGARSLRRGRPESDPRNSDTREAEGPALAVQWLKLGDNAGDTGSTSSHATLLFSR